MDRKLEQLALDSIAQNANYAQGANGKMIEYVARLVISNTKPTESILEMGPAEGKATRKLDEYFQQVHVVDASPSYLKLIENELPNVKTYLSFFEDFIPSQKYDNILMSHVLEHVEEPDLVLEVALKWLKPNGKIFASVPNSNSVHRELGVRMGLLQTHNQLNESDLKIGHRRVFNMKEFKLLFRRPNLRIIKSGGFFLKFFSNKELEEHFSDEFLEGLMSIGELAPEKAAELYIIATLDS